MTQHNSSEMHYRTLGRTGEQVSAIGLGGWHIGFDYIPEQDAITLVRTAIDRGINFLDNSWDYNEGASEIRMGKALKDGYREKVFLMTKIDGRTRTEAEKQLNESLKRLQTDRIELVQYHEILRYEDPHRIFDEDGAHAALTAARKAGKLRYIGFTGHKDPHIHLHTLEVAREAGFTFDTVQMPLNVMDAHYRSFERQVLPELIKDNIAPLANDRRNRRGSDYRDESSYQSGNYGYQNYVDLDQYRHYFREGFQRGYADGYNSQSQYGTYSGGRRSILGSILNGIMNLRSY